MRQEPHPPELCIRPARPSDFDVVDSLFSRAYPALLRADYDTKTLQDILPIISRANPRLLATGTYYLAFLGDDLVGAGGWSWIGPHGAVGPRHMAHSRHVVTHHDHQRSGIGRQLLSHCINEAGRQGARILNCQSTLTGEQLYAALGFRRVADIDVFLCPGVSFPAVHMQLPLAGEMKKAG
ncbi:GNAT family N-acetyltransferase [Aliiroseovarius sp. PTFE2010]|uniref:GNAT family N-acetyltransferase n=1 Tax=Aliiroseovarius sp. PTFE2010 TaxID=3417190 RepID=UPI003CF64762